jgi:acetyltransferase-like isoleucine patch superfamily enzyme
MFQLARIMGRKIRTAILRQRLYKLGVNDRVDRRARFENAKKIAIGDGCRLEAGVILRANTSSEPGITIAQDVSIKEYTMVNANEGSVSIGKRSWIGPYCLVYGNGTVHIGKDVLIAAHTSINTVSHVAVDTSSPMNSQGIYRDAVVIEEDVWIGLNCTILQGVTVGRGSIIGAGAVVTRDIPPFSIAMGVPARVVGSRIEIREVV